MSSVISVENLSKKYTIGHQKQERYTTCATFWRMAQNVSPISCAIRLQFLKIKIAEHEALTKEIKGLRQEAVQVQARQHSGVSPRKGAK